MAAVAEEKHFLFLDTETSGLPDVSLRKRYHPSAIEHYKNSRLLQFAYALTNAHCDIVETGSFIVLPRADLIVAEHYEYNHMTLQLCQTQGVDIAVIMAKINELLVKYRPLILGYNVTFDIDVILAEMYRYAFNPNELHQAIYCDLCKLINDTFNKRRRFLHLNQAYKQFLPDLPDLHWHDAVDDVQATIELCRLYQSTRPHRDLPISYCRELAYVSSSSSSTQMKPGSGGETDCHNVPESPYH